MLLLFRNPHDHSDTVKIDPSELVESGVPLISEGEHEGDEYEYVAPVIVLVIDNKYKDQHLRIGSNEVGVNIVRDREGRCDVLVSDHTTDRHWQLVLGRPGATSVRPALHQPGKVLVEDQQQTARDALEDILGWATSRDGSPEGDDRSLSEIEDIARNALT